MFLRELVTFVHPRELIMQTIYYKNMCEGEWPSQGIRIICYYVCYLAVILHLLLITDMSQKIKPKTS